jgi:hypothetical protein
VASNVTWSLRIKASYPAPLALSRDAGSHRGVFVISISGSRVDRHPPPAIFRRLRGVGLKAIVVRSPCGGIGRRARLKIEFRKECWFDSGQGHQAENISNNNSLHYWFDSRFSKKFSRYVENTRKSLPQPSGLLAFLLVSGEQTFAATFAIPNKGIEQMARKNDGACTNPKQIRRPHGQPFPSMPREMEKPFKLLSSKALKPISI